MTVNEKVRDRLSFLAKVQYKDLLPEMMWCSGYLVGLVDNGIITNQEYGEMFKEIGKIYQDRKERKA